MIYRIVIQRIIADPVVFARFWANLATIIWAGIVFTKTDTLRITAYAWTAMYIHEDVLAGVLGFFSVAQMGWLLSGKKSLGLCAIGYGVLSLWWSTVFLSVALSPHGIQPTSTSCAFVVAVLAYYGFLANPTEPRRGAAA